MPAVRGFPGVYVFFIGFLQVQEEVRQGIFKKREDDTQHKEGFEEKNLLMTAFPQVGVQRSCLGQYRVSQVSPMLRDVGVKVMAVSDWPAPLCDAHNHVIFRSEVPSRVPGWLAVTVFSISRSNGTRATLAWIPKFSLHDKPNLPRLPPSRHLATPPPELERSSTSSSKVSHVQTAPACHYFASFNTKPLQYQGANNTHMTTGMTRTDEHR